jgi:hypothetical protein
MRWLAFWWHVTPLMFRHSLGRWYVFRDCPRWVLEELAEVQKHDDNADADTSSFLAEAAAELSRRNRFPQPPTK